MINSNTYHKPKTIQNAIELSLESSLKTKFIAGGTDLLVNKFQGNEDTPCIIDISGISELKKVTKSANKVHIGALVTLFELSVNPIICAEFPSISEAANLIASPVLRKSATVGGNILCENRCSFYNQSEWWREAVGYCLKCEGAICIATGSKKSCYSKYVSDLAPVLLAYQADIILEAKNGEFSIPLSTIFTGDGLNPINLPSNSIIKGFDLNSNLVEKCVFFKLRLRESMDFSSLSTAVSLNKDKTVTIVLGGCDPQPVILKGEFSEKNELIKQAIKKPRVIDNDTFSRVYRKKMINVFLTRSFIKLESN